MASTGTPPGVSTVDLTMRTPGSRRRSDADMAVLTQQMSDEKRFREERARKTDVLSPSSVRQRVPLQLC